MSDLGKDQTSALHIGWWRGGRIVYELTPRPTERQIRKRGALVAAAICLVWLAAGVVSAVVQFGVGSGYAAAPAAIGFAALAALPVASTLGWCLAPLGVQSRKAFLPMTIGVVLFTDLELTLGYAGLVAIFGNPGSALFVAVFAIPVGLAIFGLPGLAMAIPSAWYWEHVMRRTFTASAPEGGDRGSGGQPR